MGKPALLLLFLAFRLTAQPDFVQQGYDHFYNLEYEQAIADFGRAVALHPDDPEMHNHLAQTIVVEEMYRNGALESELVSGTNSFIRRAKLNTSPETEKRFLDVLAKAMSISEGRLRQNPDDTAALYALGISYGLRSNFYWVVKKAWRDSLKDANAARRMHNRVSELEPANVDARLVQGLHDYIVGSLPWTYRMLGFMVGIHGDKAKGIRTVQEVAANGKVNRLDAEIFLCALYRRENQTRLAIPLVEDLIRRFPRNYLLRLELSQMYSMAGDKTRAIEAAEAIAQLKTRHAAGYDRVPWEKVYFQEGTIQFWYNDLDRALENMKKVAARSEDVDLNTGVFAWLRIGQIYDLTHHRTEALQAYQKAIAYAPQADAAQESRKYLASPYRRL
ncbi:MAG TPA: tetratricopeptide repeat protein [Bryobacteraceae bacterium]